MPHLVKGLSDVQCYNKSLTLGSEGKADYRLSGNGETHTGSQLEVSHCPPSIQGTVG